MLSVQNIHLGQAENNNESVIMHAARRGGGRRPSRRGLSSRTRWALGAGAATAGIAIMGRTKLGRRIGRKVVRSRAFGRVRKAAVTGLRRVRGTKVGLGLRRFGNARRAGARRIGAAVRGAASRVGARIGASRVGTAVRRSKSFGIRVRRSVGGVKRYATGARKRASIGIRRATRGRRSVTRITSRAISRRR